MYPSLLPFFPCASIAFGLSSFYSRWSGLVLRPANAAEHFLIQLSFSFHGNGFGDPSTVLADDALHLKESERPVICTYQHDLLWFRVMSTRISTSEWLLGYLADNGPTSTHRLREAADDAGYRGVGLGYAKSKLVKLGLAVYDYETKWQGSMVMRLIDQEPLPGTRPGKDGDRDGLRHAVPPQLMGKVDRLPPDTAQEFVRTRIIVQAPEDRLPYRVEADPDAKILHVFMDADWGIRVYENEE